MAPIQNIAYVLVGSAALASCKPLHVRQDATSTAVEPSSKADAAEAAGTTNMEELYELTNRTYWCNSDEWDTLDPEKMQRNWENGDLAIGRWLANWAEYVTDGNPNDGWADNIISVADPNIGDDGLGGCGVIGASCDPDIDCDDWASRGYGAHYWAIRALVGFHDKLNVAYTHLDSKVMQEFLRLDEIADDFTSPSNWSNMDDLAAVLGAIFYMIGGVAGFGGLASSWVASAAARQGISKAARARYQTWINNIGDDKAKKRVQERLDAYVASSEAMTARALSDAGDAGQMALALGSSTYMLGGIFGVVGIGSEDVFGEVEAGDLQPTLSALFDSGLGYLEQLGRVATGRADPDLDDDYDALPGQVGTAGLPVENAIAMFFHDANMLIGAADPTFNETLEAAFTTMTPRIVDAALVTGKFWVFADEEMETEERCAEFADTGEDDEWPWLGAQWVDDYCVRLMRSSDSNEDCGSSFCSKHTATQENYDALEDKYGFDMYEYYKSALDCTINEGKDGVPDLWDLPEDGAFPRCWFGIRARKGIEECSPYDGGTRTCSIRFSDF